MTLDEHVNHLGGLVGNLQSLEFALRIFLNRQPDARPIGMPYGTDIYYTPVGSTLPENDLTSYDSLGELIAKFNSVANAKGTKTIDANIVELRDALAHGRVSSALANEHMRLLKFDRPKGGAVRVVFNQEMNSDWFKGQKTRVYEAIMTVKASLEP